MKKIATIFIFIVSFVVYAYTTSPYLQAGDSAEMATATITRGVPHQPSYPVYVYLANAFIALPIPYIPQHIQIPGVPVYNLENTTSYRIKIYRSGLFSGLMQALANSYFFLLLTELVKKVTGNQVKRSGVILAIIATSSYATLQTMWLYATKPEVFAVNNLFANALLYYMCQWWNDPFRKTLPKRLMLLAGCAFSHHQTIILLLPACLLILIYKKQEVVSGSTKSIIKDWIELPADRKFNKAFPLVFICLLGIVPYGISLFLLASKQPFLNWGQISNPLAVLPALLRVDYGTIGAYLSNTPNPTIPIDQIPFFLTHISREESVYFIVIALIGYLSIFRSNKKAFTIITLGFIFTGPLFLLYANFALDSEFSQATVARFYMLPSIFLCAAFFWGMYNANELIEKTRSSQKDNKEALQIGHLVFYGALITLVVATSLKNAPAYDNLTHKYSATVVNSVEPNALVMITGDIPSMTLQYMQAVEGQKKDRIIFSPGQFHLEWFQKQLRTRFPQLKIPEPKKGNKYTTVTQVVDANWGKYPIYVSPEFLEIDPELQQKYTLWPKGLMLKVEEKSTKYNLEEFLAENDRIYSSIDVEEFSRLRAKKYQLESPLVTFYARHFYNAGAVLQTVHRYSDALNQFKRSLSIDPSFAQNYKSIGIILSATPDYPYPDLETAANMLTKFLQTEKRMTVSDYNLAIKLLDQIEKERKALQVEEQKLMEQERQQSGKSDEKEPRPATESADQKNE